MSVTTFSLKSPTSIYVIACGVNRARYILRCTNESYHFTARRKKFDFDSSRNYSFFTEFVSFSTLNMLQFFNRLYYSILLLKRNCEP